MYTTCEDSKKLVKFKDISYKTTLDIDNSIFIWVQRVGRVMVNPTILGDNIFKLY